jgi:hypothetical protein
MNSLKNGNGKGKIFTPFAAFVRLGTRRLTAAFSAVLLTTAMFTAALFFASCGSADEAGDIELPPPPPRKTNPTRPNPTPVHI